MGQVPSNRHSQISRICPLEKPTQSRLGEVDVTQNDQTRKRARRGTGEGAIYREPNGLWAASVEVGWAPDGRRLRRKIRGRTKAVVRLTSSGERLLEVARAVLRDHDALMREVELLKSDIRGVVRVACYPIHIPGFLGPIIRTFRLAEPKIAIDLSRVRDDRARDGDAVIADLMNGTVDFAIAPRQRGLGGVELYESHVVVVLPDDHPMRDAQQVDLAAIEGEPLLVTPRGHYTREQVEHCLAHLPLECRQPHVSMETSSAIALIALGASGAGIPIVADLHLSQTERERRYPTLLGPDGPISTTVMMFVHPKRPLSEPASIFLDHVKASAAQGMC